MNNQRIKKDIKGNVLNVGDKAQELYGGETVTIINLYGEDESIIVTFDGNESDGEFKVYEENLLKL
jgi:hypothetical protein